MHYNGLLHFQSFFITLLVLKNKTLKFNASNDELLPFLQNNKNIIMLNENTMLSDVICRTTTVYFIHDNQYKRKNRN